MLRMSRAGLLAMADKEEDAYCNDGDHGWVKLVDVEKYGQY